MVTFGQNGRSYTTNIDSTLPKHNIQLNIVSDQPRRVRYRADTVKLYMHIKQPNGLAVVCLKQVNEHFTILSNRYYYIEVR